MNGLFAQGVFTLSSWLMSFPNEPQPRSCKSVRKQKAGWQKVRGWVGLWVIPAI